jgi:hypothetical protein
VNYYNYFTEIEDAFIRRRGKSLFLSPLDWALIELWREEGVPLHIVIRGIETVFDNQQKDPKRKRSIKSLSFCREEVEALHAEWLEAQVGNSDSETDEEPDGQFSREQTGAHLDELITRLRAVEHGTVKESCARAAEKLAELQAGLTEDVSQTEASLGDVEKFLDAEIKANFERETLKTLEAEVAENLKSYKSKMTAEVYAKTFDLMLLKLLRETAGVPRLSLFYI